MSRPGRQVAAGSVLALALACGACGSQARPVVSNPPTPKTHPPQRSETTDVTIAQIERENGTARQPTTRTAPRQAAPTPTPAATTPPAATADKPPITPAYIPFPASRKREMAAYALRHYGIHTWRLRHPKVIVEHYTATDTAAQAIDIFRPDVPDIELHELPGVCSHYVIDRDGTIDAVVHTSIMCRHTVGLNFTAIGIEHAGFSDQEILDNKAQMRSSLALTRYLRCRYGIRIRNVIGHNESLTSPYHHEDVAALRTQTHQDWKKADMDVYRKRLRGLGGC